MFADLRGPRDTGQATRGVAGVCVRPAADLVIAQPAFGRVMHPLVPRADSVAVCNTGLLRSLLAPAVVDGFPEHLVAPLERAGFAVDTYLQVVGKWPEGNGSTIYHDALAQARTGGAP